MKFPIAAQMARKVCWTWSYKVKQNAWKSVFVERKIGKLMQMKTLHKYRK